MGQNTRSARYYSCRADEKKLYKKCLSNMGEKENERMRRKKIEAKSKAQYNTIRTKSSELV